MKIKLGIKSLIFIYLFFLVAFFVPPVIAGHNLPALDGTSRNSTADTQCGTIGGGVRDCDFLTQHPDPPNYQLWNTNMQTLMWTGSDGPRSIRIDYCLGAFNNALSCYPVADVNNVAANINGFVFKGAITLSGGNPQDVRFNHWAQVHVRAVNVSTFTDVYGRGRRVWASDLSAPSAKNVGESFPVSWNAKNAGWMRLSYSGPITCDIGSGEEIGTTNPDFPGIVTCTGTGAGRVDFDLEACGPGSYDSNRDDLYTCINETRSVDIVSGPPPTSPPPPPGCQGDCAQYISQNIPAAAGTGQSFSVSITMKNVGTTTWTAGDQYKLGSQNPENNSTWGLNRVNVPSTVSPGQEVTFNFNPIAPSSPGNYDFQWRMLREGVQWFGDFTPNVVINVTSGGGPPPPPPPPPTSPPPPSPPPGECNDSSSIIFTDSIPDTLNPGQTESFTVRVTDTGDTRWYHGSAYQFLQQSSLSINPSYGHLPRGIYPGDNVDWTFTLTAPNSPGTYTLNMQMIHYAGWDYIKPDGTTCSAPTSNTYFGDIATRTFNVSQPNYTLTVNSSGASSVPISGSPSTYDGITNYSRTAASGTGVALTASVTQGNANFSNWSGCNSTSGSGNRTCNVIVTNNRTVTANYVTSIPTTSNVSVTLPNYCVSGPSTTVVWNYSDPSGSPQSAYQVQIDDQPSFNSPEWDSDKVLSSSQSNNTGNCNPSNPNGTGPGTCRIGFNTTYSVRVRTWNSYDVKSAWQNATSCNGDGCQPNGQWKTPSHAYPNANSPYQFIWSPANPAVNSPIQFTDRAWFDPSSNQKAWSWTFVPAGGGPGSSTVQNPIYTFNSEGVYQVTERVRDNALPPGQYCTGPTQAVNIQKPIPIWKEIAPR